jgi:threonine synthase
MRTSGTASPVIPQPAARANDEESFVCLICGRRYRADVFELFCPDCGDPLLSAFVPESPAIRAREPMGIARYLEFLPLDKFDPALSLGEGGTPFQELSRLRAKFHTPHLFAKNEAVNPTGSFKDRGTIVAIHQAKARGFKTVGTISTGNMAGSTAAYAARAGLKSVIFVKEDTPEEKILAAAVFGARVVKVRSDYSVLFRKSFEIGRSRGIYFMNSVDPYRIEGYKVAAYEIYEQLGGAAPEFVFVPVSAGGHLLGLLRGFQDLKRTRMIRKIPLFVGVQAQGCAPIARAFARGRTDTVPFPNPRTVAHAISNPNPPGGRIVLRALAATGGFMTGVTEAEILKAQRLLAEYEGIFCDPASATALAAYLKMAGQNLVPSRARSVLIITGSGLKTISDLDPASFRIADADLADLDRTRANPSH